MRVFSLVLALLLLSGAATGGTSGEAGSNLTQKDVVELCDPAASGTLPLYCRYYVMGLMDGVASATGVCIPSTTSSERVRRVIETALSADPDEFHHPAFRGVHEALLGAFPCS